MQVAKHASTQLARLGIRVNAIAPGSMSFSRASLLQRTIAKVLFASLPIGVGLGAYADPQT